MSKQSRSKAEQSIKKMFIPAEKFKYPRPEKGEYNKVVATASLEKLFLIASDFHVSPEYFQKVHAEEDIDFVFSHEVLGVSADSSSGSVDGVFKWQVEVKCTPNDGDDEAFLSISANYFVLYQGITPGCSEAAMKAFFEKVGRIASYPYFRSHVSQTSWESEAQLPLLPVITG